jgi:hypothetical protein
MKKTFVTLIFLAICWQIQPRQISAQSTRPDELPRYEVGVDFTTLTLSESQTHLGAGSRFTVNWNRHVALEAAANFFPGCTTCASQITGRITEGFFGVKAGQRFKKFGIFGKARPGFISFSKGFFELTPTGGTGPFPFDVVVRRQTNLAADLGGVVEIYPSGRLLLRFDGSAVLDHYGSRTIHSFSFDPTTSAITPFTFQSRGYTRRLFQFSAGVGFRF